MNRLKSAYQKWLGKTSYDLFITLTFDRQISSFTAWSVVRNYYLDGFDKFIKYVAVEEFTLAGRPHFHLLLKSDLVSLTEEHLLAWKFGRVKVYEANDRALGYVLKRVAYGAEVETNIPNR